MYAKKFLALFLSAALMVSMLAGCNKQPDDGEGDGSSSSSSQGTSQNGGNGGSGNSGSQGGGSSSGGETEQPDEDEKPGEDEDEPGDDDNVPAVDNFLNLNRINKIVKQTDARINVVNNSDLTAALDNFASRIKEVYSEEDFGRGFFFLQISKYFKSGVEDYLVDVDFLTAEDFEEGFDVQYADNGPFYTMEDAIAQDILGTENVYTMLTYAASAVPVTTADGVSGYLFALIFN